MRVNEVQREQRVRGGEGLDSAPCTHSGAPTSSFFNCGVKTTLVSPNKRMRKEGLWRIYKTF